VVEVNVQDLNQLFSLEIKDSGIGLKYNESSQVFSRFYRGNEGSGKASGTGLGLPVAKAIIDAHGGSINLHGESGEGTTATVTLPLEVKLRAVK
jgi:two-component system sensor histidine kinase VicK